jgi:hypothetical protein
MKTLMKFIALLLFVMLWVSPAWPGAEQESCAEASLSAEDEDVVEMLDMLELLELLRDMDVLAAMEDTQ